MIIKRREFLKMVPALGLSMGMSQSLIIKPEQDNKKIINALQQAVEEFYSQNFYGIDWGSDWDNEIHQQNLIYAVHKIHPTTHNDLAFVVAMRNVFYPAASVIDEYVCRKTTGKSNAPDHPLLHDTRWGVPFTYRLIAYQEQVTCVIQELTDKHWDQNQEIWHGIYYGRMKPDEFYSLFTDHYKKQLTITDAKQIFDGLDYIRNRFTTYAECSTVVSRAMEILKA